MFTSCSKGEKNKTVESISQSFHEHGTLRGVCQSRTGELLEAGLQEEGRSPFSCKYTKMQVQKKPDVLLWNMMMIIICTNALQLSKTTIIVLF